MVNHHPTKFGGHRHCGSGEIMFLVVKGQDSTCPRLNRHTAKYDGHRHCNSGDMMFLVVKGPDSTCPHLNSSLLLIYKAHGMPCSQTQTFRM